MGYLPPLSLTNELAAWKVIEVKANYWLAKYSESMNEDVNMVEKDTEEPFLDENKRRYVESRKLEKEILHELKQCGGLIRKFS